MFPCSKYLFGNVHHFVILLSQDSSFEGAFLRLPMQQATMITTESVAMHNTERMIVYNLMPSFSSTVEVVDKDSAGVSEGVACEDICLLVGGDVPGLLVDDDVTGLLVEKYVVRLLVEGDDTRLLVGVSLFVCDVNLDLLDDGDVIWPLGI